MVEVDRFGLNEQLRPIDLRELAVQLINGRIRVSSRCCRLACTSRPADASMPACDIGLAIWPDTSFVICTVLLDFGVVSRRKTVHVANLAVCECLVVYLRRK